MEDEYAFKGDIIYCLSPTDICSLKDGYIVVKDGRVRAVQRAEPGSLKIHDFSGRLIIPSFTDLHTHAAQFANKGKGYDQKLLDWLVNTTFPEETKFSNLDYAEKVYKEFVFGLWQNGITHSVVMPTLHVQSTKRLIDMFHRAGMYCHIGKVNMDMGLGDTLRESTADSVAGTKELIKYCKDLAPYITYTVTPRFVLSCTSKLLQELGNISVENGLPVHTHLSENQEEVKRVHDMYPDCPNYASVYDKFRLLKDQRTVMAHCIYSGNQPGEVKLLINDKTWIAHCPTSNSNLASGIAPISAYMDRQIQMGLGSDISGGHTLNMFEIMRYAIQCSKLKSLQDEGLKPLSVQQVFYLATLGGGSFFGQTGSFIPGYKFNALILKNELINEEPLQTLERLIYSADHSVIETRMLDGKIFEPPK